MQKNLFQSADYQEIVSRIERLEPEAPARWGKMNAHEMLLHLIDSAQMGLDQRPVKDRSNFITRSLVKWLVLRSNRMPKNVGTAPELDQKRKGSRPDSWDKDKARLLQLLAEFVQTPADYAFGRHPIFGKMTRQQWGRLAYQHNHHHLAQFGV